MTLLRGLALGAERDHELTCPDAPLEDVFVAQVVWLMAEELGQAGALGDVEVDDGMGVLFFGALL